MKINNICLLGPVLESLHVDSHSNKLHFNQKYKKNSSFRSNIRISNQKSINLCGFGIRQNFGFYPNITSNLCPFSWLTKPEYCSQYCCGEINACRFVQLTE